MELTRAGKVIRFIESSCLVPEGADVGQPIRLREWQKQEIVRIYDNPAVTRRAILSMGRKCGKSTLSACLLLAHLLGPEKRVNSQIYSTAKSRDQAALVYGLAAKMVRMSAVMDRHVTVKESAKMLVNPAHGAVYRALSADASTAHGLSPVLVIHDELGQVRGPRSDLYDALETAGAAHDQTLSIIISTQAPTDADLLSVLIDDAIKGKDPRVTVSLYTADKDADPFAAETIAQANPAFGDYQNRDTIMQMAEEARRMPSAEASFRNLILNQRVEAHNPYVSHGVWMANGDKPVSLAGREVWIGLDLSSVNDLTALVMVAKDGDRWDVEPMFWLPEAGLRERARSDRVPYDLWHDDGYLHTTPGASVEYEYIAHRIKEIWDSHDVQALAFDRWGMRYLMPWLKEAGLTDDDMQRMRPFGQGFKDMTPALRELESVLVNGKMRHGKHPVLTMCAANAVAQTDPAGGRKLAKHKSTGRIDGMVSLAMAIATASEREEIREPEYRMVFA